MSARRRFRFPGSIVVDFSGGGAFRGWPSVLSFR